MQEVTEVANVIRDLNDTIPLSGRPFIMTASSRDPTTPRLVDLASLTVSDDIRGLFDVPDVAPVNEEAAINEETPEE